MKSEIRQTREGKFMVVQFDPAECTWSECLKAAYDRHGAGVKHLPCISVAAGGACAAILRKDMQRGQASGNL